MLVWDLRSSSGRIEAPLRLVPQGARFLPRVSVADLGSGVAPESPLRVAVAGLMGGTPLEPPIATGSSSDSPRRRQRRPIWVWWAAGGAAALVLGGAVVALDQNRSGDALTVHVQK